MKLILNNGYPWPPTPATTEAQLETAASLASGHQLVLEGVVDLEVAHDLVVEFADEKAQQAAQQQTGWEAVGLRHLRAGLAREGGYSLPGIIVYKRLISAAWDAPAAEYCGFRLALSSVPMTGATNNKEQAA